MLGENPSFIWRSVWSASKLLKRECRWRIRNGQKVRICGMPWLLDENNAQIQTPMPDNGENLLVANLLEPSGASWDVEKVAGMFNVADQRAIFQIPLSIRQAEDELIWFLETRGQYSVRSGYKLLRSMYADNPPNDVEEFLWKSIWQIHAPSKFVNLLWRAARGCLPTREALHRRHISSEVHCPFCLQNIETSIHVLVSCDFAKAAWVKSDVGFFLGGSTCFKEWLLMIFKLVPRVNWGKVAAIVWGVWQQRNKLVWENRSPNMHAAVHGSLAFLSSWVEANARNSLSQHVSSATVWSKPPTGWTKCNVDGAIFENSSAIGAVFRDDHGRTTSAFVRPGLQVSRPEFVEALGVREVLSWIRDRGRSHIIIESGLRVVQALDRNTDNSSFGLIIEVCKVMLATL